MNAIVATGLENRKYLCKKHRDIGIFEAAVACIQQNHVFNRGQF